MDAITSACEKSCVRDCQVASVMISCQKRLFIYACYLRQPAFLFSLSLVKIGNTSYFYELVVRHQLKMLRHSTISMMDTEQDLDRCLQSPFPWWITEQDRDGRLQPLFLWWRLSNILIPVQSSFLWCRLRKIVIDVYSVNFFRWPLNVSRYLYHRY